MSNPSMTGDVVERLRARKVSIDDGPDGRGGWYSHDEPDPLCDEAASLITKQADRIAVLEAEKADVLERKDQFTHNAKSQRFDDITDAATGAAHGYLVAQEDTLDTVRAWAGHYRHRAEKAEAELAARNSLVTP